MGCKPFSYATRVGPPGWRSSRKPRGSPTARLKGVSKGRSRGVTGGQTKGSGGPEDGAATLLNELEELDVRVRHCFTRDTVSELLQHELIQRNPFAALSTCLYAIKVAESRPLVTGLRLCGCQLEEILSRVLGLVYRHKGNDVQTTVDALYDVSPRDGAWVD